MVRYYISHFLLYKCWGDLTFYDSSNQTFIMNGVFLFFMHLGMSYDPALTKPMEEELTSLGFTALKDSDDVEKSLHQKGTSLLVINSVCGCAAGKARPGIKLSLKNKNKPQNLFTVFAGVDRVATEQARKHIQFPPSSPSIALFKDGKVAQFIPRQDIENKTAEDIADALTKMFDKYVN